MRKRFGVPAIPVCILALAILFLNPLVLAQKGASKLEGVVKDTTGAIIPGAPDP